MYQNLVTEAFPGEADRRGWCWGCQVRFLGPDLRTIHEAKVCNLWYGVQIANPDPYYPDGCIPVSLTRQLIYSIKLVVFPAARSTTKGRQA